MNFEFEIAGQIYKGSLEFKDGRYKINLNDKILDADLQRISENVFSLILNGKSHQIFLADEKAKTYISIDGEQYVVATQEISETSKTKSATVSSLKTEKKTITSKMPGKIVKVAVSAGNEVNEGQLLVIVEAMKMENQILASHKGKIKKVYVSQGKQINFGDSLVEFE